MSLADGSDGFLFDGSWEHGVRQGQGTCIVKGKGQFTGLWEADAMRSGLLFDHAGNSFQGVFRDGALVEGVWHDGQSTASYEGQWNADPGPDANCDANADTDANCDAARKRMRMRNMQPHGVGNATYACGARYSGSLRRGRRHGQGALSLPLSSGDEPRRAQEWCAGAWEDDALHGQCTLAWAGASEGRDLELDAEFRHGALAGDASVVVRAASGEREVIFSGLLADWGSGSQELPGWLESMPAMDVRAACEAGDFECGFAPISSAAGTLVTADAHTAGDAGDAGDAASVTDESE